MVDWQVERCGVRELELCHISVSSLSSPVVSLLLVEMIDISLESVFSATGILGCSTTGMVISVADFVIEKRRD